MALSGRRCDLDVLTAVLCALPPSTFINWTSSVRKSCFFCGRRSPTVDLHSPEVKAQSCTAGPGRHCEEGIWVCQPQGRQLSPRGSYCRTALRLPHLETWVPPLHTTGPESSTRRGPSVPVSLGGKQRGWRGWFLRVLPALRVSALHFRFVRHRFPPLSLLPLPLLIVSGSTVCTPLLSYKNNSYLLLTLLSSPKCSLLRL